MGLPSNPQTLATYDITQAPQARSFVKTVSDLLVAISSSVFIAGLMNGVSALFNSALIFKGVDLGTITTNQTVECANASGVAVSFTVATAFNPTITLNHLALGVPVTISFTNAAGGNILIKVAATQPGGTAYAGVLWKTSASGNNMSTTGLIVAAGAFVVASGSATPANSTWTLFQVAN